MEGEAALPSIRAFQESEVQAERIWLWRGPGVSSVFFSLRSEQAREKRDPYEYMPVNPCHWLQSWFESFRSALTAFEKTSALVFPFCSWRTMDRGCSSCQKRKLTAGLPPDVNCRCLSIAPVGNSDNHNTDRANQSVCCVTKSVPRKVRQDAYISARVPPMCVV